MTYEEINELKKAAEAGDARAQYDLAKVYYSDLVKDGAYNEKQALYWFEKAAEQGFADAQYWYGHCLKCGVGIRFSNKRSAVVWFEKAAEQGHTAAQKELYRAYIDGVNCERNYGKALRWLKSVIDTEDREAEYELASLYESGTVVKDINGKQILPDLALAFDRYLSSAEKGYFLAMEKVGDFYRGGKGIDRSLEKAADWYLKGAEACCYGCWTKLGEMYFNGEFFEKDYKKAFECFEKASCSDVVGKKLAADCYYYGYGVKQNFEEAKKLYVSAAKNDNYGFNGIRMAVARIFSEEGPLNDGKEATALLKAEVNQMGSPEAYYEYAVRCLGEGMTDEELKNVYGIKRDEANAALYLKIAADKGHVRAAYMYGKCLLNGIGTEKDFTAAKEQLTKAADAGDADAKKLLKDLQ